MTTKSRKALLLFNDPHAMRICRELATEIGFETSVLFLQIEFLISTSRNYRDGQWWTYQALKDLKSNHFPYWSESTISRLIKELINKKLVIVGNYNKLKTDRTQWFSLNEEGINKLSSVRLAEVKTVAKEHDSDILQNEICILQNDESMLSNCKMQVVKLQDASCQIDGALPETTSETTSNIKTLLHVELPKPQLDRAPVEQPTEEVKEELPVKVKKCWKPMMKFHAAVLAIMEKWKTEMNYPKSTLTPERGRAIEARLDEGKTQEDIIQGILGCKATPHNMGKNDRNTVYNDIELICRDATKLEKFIAAAPKSKNVAAKVTPIRPALSIDEIHAKMDAQQKIEEEERRKGQRY